MHSSTAKEPPLGTLVVVCVGLCMVRLPARSLQLESFRGNMDRFYSAYASSKCNGHGVRSWYIVCLEVISQGCRAGRVSLQSPQMVHFCLSLLWLSTCYFTSPQFTFDQVAHFWLPLKLVPFSGTTRCVLRHSLCFQKGFPAWIVSSGKCIFVLGVKLKQFLSFIAFLLFCHHILILFST